MTLTRTALSIILLTTIGLVVIVHLVSRNTILREFENLEHRLAVENLERGRRALARAVSHLESVTRDWAWWDDTFEFVQGENEDYEESNLIDETFISQRFSIMAFHDAGGRRIWARAFDLEAEDWTELPEGFDAFTAPDAELLRHSDPERTRHGLLTLPGRILLVASCAILTSENEGPPAGTLIIAQDLDEERMSEIRESTRLNLEFLRPGSEVPLPSEEMEMRVRRDVIEGVRVLPDIFGEPALTLRLVSEREITMQGLSALQHELLGVGAAATVFGLVILWLIRIRILSRLKDLGVQVAAIGRERDFSRRVEISGSDELNLLAEDVNTMVGELEHSRSELSLRLEEIREHRRQLGEVADSIRAGIFVVDAETMTVVQANRHALEMVGHEESEVLYQPCQKHLCPAPRGTCPARDQDEPGARTRLLVTGEGAKTIIKYVSPIQRDGRPHYLETLIDITELAEAREKLRVSEETYRAIFTSTGTAMLIVDGQGRIELANPGFAELSGCDVEELEGRMHWSAFFESEDAAALEAFLNGTLTGDDSFACSRFRSRAGGLRDVDITARPVTGTRRLVLSLLDTTGRLETQRMLTRSLEEKSTLLREVHHRVKNNLQVIMSLMQLQGDSDDCDPDDIFKRSCNRIRSMALVHESLYASTGNLSRIDFGNYCRRLCDQIAWSYAGSRHNVSLVVEFDQVDLDIGRAVPCGLLINELVSNAFKHAYPQGGGEVRVTVSRNGSLCEIAVRDGGIGLDPSGNGQRRQGLGLQLVEALSRQIDGELRWKQEDGTTARVVFEL